MHASLALLDEPMTAVDAVADVLDLFAVAVFIVDRSANVLHVNLAARALARERDGLSIENGHLRAGAHSAQLRHVITSAGGAVLLPRAAKQPITLTVHALRRHALAVIAVRPDETTTFRLGGLYGLTPAEARVADLLVQGRTTTEIAATLDVTQNTLKTHLKRIYAKTGTHGQSGLIRLGILLSVRG